MDAAGFAGWRKTLAGLCLGVLPAIASAQPWMAQTTKDSHLRAGPALEYPVVAVLLRATEVAVEGCLADYRWCDVTVAGYRGWVYGGNLAYAWQGQPAPVLDVGPVIGIAILGFALDDYWGQHYRATPWYPQRHEWIRRVPPPVAHPRPPGPPPGLPPGWPHGVQPPGVRPPDVHAPRPVPPVTRPPEVREPDGRPPHGRPPAVQPPGVQPPTVQPPGTPGQRPPVTPQPPVSQPRPPGGPAPGPGTPPPRPRAHDGPSAQDGPRAGSGPRGPDAAPRPAPPATDPERRPQRPATSGKRSETD